MSECYCNTVGMIPHNFQRSALGKCKMCKGWRRDVPTYLQLREVFSAELPGALRGGIGLPFPKSVFEGIRLQGERTSYGVPTVWTTVHRDDIYRLVDRCRLAMQRDRGHEKVPLEN